MCCFAATSQWQCKPKCRNLCAVHAGSLPQDQRLINAAESPQSSGTGLLPLGASSHSSSPHRNAGNPLRRHNPYLRPQGSSPEPSSPALPLAMPSDLWGSVSMSVSPSLPLASNSLSVYGPQPLTAMLVLPQPALWKTVTAGERQPSPDFQDQLPMHSTHNMHSMDAMQPVSPETPSAAQTTSLYFSTDPLLPLYIQQRFPLSPPSTHMGLTLPPQTGVTRQATPPGQVAPQLPS